MKIIVTPRSVYGRTLYYPVNAAADALAKIAGSSTLTKEALALATVHLKMEVEIFSEEVKLADIVAAAGSVM